MRVCSLIVGLPDCLFSSVKQPFQIPAKLPYAITSPIAILESSGLYLYVKRVQEINSRLSAGP